MSNLTESVNEFSNSSREKRICDLKVQLKPWICIFDAVSCSLRRKIDVDNFSVDFNAHDDFHLYIGVCYYESSFQDINKYIAFCPIHRFLGYITILCRILNNTDVTLKTCFISAFQS